MKTILILCFLLLGSFASAFDGRVFPPDQKPDDKRLKDAVTLHDYHPFRAVASIDDWKRRAEEISLRTRVAAGIFPALDKTPLGTVKSEAVEKDGFGIQNIYFESFPGHYVTGTLFFPVGDSVSLGLKKEKRPVVMCPHGHWKNGRFYDAGDAQAKRHIAEGGERFYNAARNPLHARCVQLARMGCLVFLYDMLGNADSVQFGEHRRGPRPDMSGSKIGEWGFVSPQSILRLQTNFGLQTWNSVRALDMMLEHPEADPDRVLVTGASGGGTQTLILTAVDERVDASFPCVMPSTAMQGGCTCENSYYLRIGQGNIDLAAVSAPKPFGMTAADDWTIELETKGHPDMVDLYTRLKARKAYEAHFDIHFKHNYNHVSRTHMYQFVNRHFGLGLPAPVLESDFASLSSDELTVWKADGSRPANYKTGAEHEKEVNATWAKDGEQKVAAAFAGNQFDDLRKGWNVILNRSYGEVEAAEFTLVKKEKLAGFIAMGGSIRNSGAGEELPALFYYPDNWNGSVTIYPTAQGKSGLYLGKPSSPTDKVRALLDQGHAVAGVDLFGQGEFLAEGEEATGNQSITYSGKKDLEPDSWQRSPVYYYGYNDSLFVRRVHDLLTTLKMVQTSDKWDVKSVHLKGEGPIGAIALAAGGVAHEFESIEAHLKGFTFGGLNDPWGEHFVPGAIRFGDVAMLVELAADGVLARDSSKLIVSGAALRGKYSKMAADPDGKVEIRK